MLIHVVHSWPDFGAGKFSCVSMVGGIPTIPIPWHQGSISLLRVTKVVIPHGRVVLAPCNACTKTVLLVTVAAAPR